MAKWTSEDDSILKETYGVATQQEIVTRLGGRAWSAICKRAQYLETHRPHTMPAEYAHFKNLEPWKKSWIACALDAEGTIGISQHRDYKGTKLEPYISVSNTKEPFVARFAEILKTENKIHYQLKHRNETGRNAIFQCSIGAMALIGVLLKEIYPYLIIKQEQARLVMRFLEIQAQHRSAAYTPEQLKIYEEVKKCNQRGLVPAP